MKKLIYATGLALTLVTGGMVHAEPAKSTSAIRNPHTVNEGGAEAGHTSFTQQQARGHIANSGFAKVSALTKGADGVWRGTAHKDGHRYKVALDFKGNVSSSPH